MRPAGKPQPREKEALSSVCGRDACRLLFCVLQADWNIVKKGWYAHVLGEAPHTFTSAAEAVKTLRVCNKDTLKTMQHRNMQLALQLLVLDPGVQSRSWPKSPWQVNQTAPGHVHVCSYMIACCPG
jgi:hypothetical protein